MQFVAQCNEKERKDRMDKEKLARIGELSRKERSGTKLTAGEKEEQRCLRAEYLQAVRENFRSTLDGIEFADKQG